MKLRQALLTFLLCFPAASGILQVVAQQEDAFPADVHRARREALAREHPDAILVIRAAEKNPRCADFQQSANFWYLTGLDLPDAVLVMGPDGEAPRLFVNTSDAWALRSTGLTASSLDGLARMTGILSVQPLDRLEPALAEALAGTKGMTLLTPLGPEEIGMQNADTAEPVDVDRRESPWDGRASRAEAFRVAILRRWPRVKVDDLQPALTRFRLIKSREEIDRIRTACRATCAGIREAMAQTRPGIAEYQIQAVAEFVYRISGCRRLAFGTIAGSGPNSTILHYAKNARRTAAGDLVVLDTGAEYRNYAADVTRTFPVSGRFTERQREVYGIVLRAVKAGLAVVRPGATLREVDRAARKVIVDAGLEHAFPHGVGHFVGLAVHDVGGWDVPFEAGMVITVEPGIYLPEEGFGIRIEETLHVTPEGVENLCAELPMEADEVEEIVGSRAGR